MRCLGHQMANEFRPFVVWEKKRRDREKSG
jgi:hypothetical protein